MPCSVCLRDKKVVAKGLCNACYQRWRKRGTTEYAPLRVRGVCSVDGCGRPHAARGFCDLHHQRVLTTGDPEQTKRPDSWGAKHKHPLFNRWSHMMRHRASHPVAGEWQDFLRFALDIGEPPDPKAKLFAADESKPIGPDNFIWKAAFTQRVEGEDEQTFKARRARAYRHVHKGRDRKYQVKVLYGLSPEQVDELYVRQQGACAICGQSEKNLIRGRILRLAIDHCHSTGAVRGLLCHQCNTGLGNFRDNPALLQRAIEYLGGAPVS